MCFSSSAVRRPAALGRCGKNHSKRGGWFTSMALCWMSTLSLQIAKLRGSLRIPPINGLPSHVLIRDSLFNKAVHKEELCAAENIKSKCYITYTLHCCKSLEFPQFQYLNYNVLRGEDDGCIVANCFYKYIYMYVLDVLFTCVQFLSRMLAKWTDDSE